MPQHFTTQLDMKLLKLVKDNPVLYNSRHPKYSDCDTREVTWQKIGDAMGRPMQRCKSRWLNIRDMLRRTIRLRLQYPDQYNRKYRYEEQMTFMLPHFKIPNATEDLSEYLEESTKVEMPPEFENSLDFAEQNPTYRKRVEELNTRSDDALHQELNATDPLEVFLLTIGSTLRKFKPYYLNQAKSKIFQICQDYELQQITDKPEASSTCDYR